MGGSYSNRVRATQFNPTGKRRRYANLQTKTYYLPELDKKIRVTVSAAGIKTINKKGPYQAFIDAGVIPAPKPQAKKTETTEKVAA